MIDQALIMCEKVDPYTSRSAQVACVAAIKTKNDRENYKRGYEVQRETSYPVEKLQKTKGNIQSNDQLHSQLSMVKLPKKTQ